MDAALSRPPAGARFATTAVFFINGIGIGAWSAAVPALKALFQLTDGGLSLILLAFAAGAVTSMPLAGALAPRWGGAGRVTAFAAYAFLISLAAPLLAPDYAALAAAAFVIGAANGVMDVSMNAHATGVEREWGSPIMSSFHAAFSVGGLAGAGLGAGLLAAGLGARGMLAATAALGVAMLLATTPRLGEGERIGAGEPLGWPERAFVGLAAAAFLCFLVEGAMVDWSGVYLVSRGSPLATASIGFAGFAAMMVAMRLIGDAVVSRIGRKGAIAGGALVASAGLALAAAANSAPLIVAGCSLVGLGLANVVPSLFTLSSRLASSPARGVAAAATAGYSGLIAGPPFVGAIASVSDLRTGIAALALTALLAAGISAASL